VAEVAGLAVIGVLLSCRSLACMCCSGRRWTGAELRRANAILRTASAFFAAELDRH
jgi:hypothetical protein